MGEEGSAHLVAPRGGRYGEVDDHRSPTGLPCWSQTGGKTKCRVKCRGINLIGGHTILLKITFNTAQCSTHSHPLSLLTRRTSPDCLSEITVLTARGDEERNTNSTRLLPYQEVIDYMMTHTYEHVLVLYFRVCSQRRERSLYEETSAKRMEWRLAGSSFKASPFWSSLPPFHLAIEGLRGELSQAFLST